MFRTGLPAGRLRTLEACLGSSATQARTRDAQLALDRGCRALILKEKDEEYLFRTSASATWTVGTALPKSFLPENVKTRVRRTTKETDIEVRLDLDGSWPV